jgi:hypothetical protein
MSGVPAHQSLVSHPQPGTNHRIFVATPAVAPQG